MIHKIVEDKIDMDQLLVVTFTNAAASEMRQRILDAIYSYLEEHPEEQRMQKQILLMPKSNICTIHSFCLDVIKNHFYEIEISPNVRIGEQTEIELLKQEVLEELFEEKYEQEDSEFLNLIQTYTTYRGDDSLKELILKIEKTIASNPFPEEWLEQKIEAFHPDVICEDFGKTSWGKILLEELEEEIQACILELEIVQKRLNLDPQLDKFARTIKADIQRLEEIQANINNWDNAYMLANALKWETWPRDSKIVSEEKEKAKGRRDEVKKKWNKVVGKTLVCDSASIKQDHQYLYPILCSLKNLIFEFDKRFAKKKQEKNLMDFHDIEHFALDILVTKDEQKRRVPTKVAMKYREKFEEIAIDEYQDSNLVQEYILNMISNGKNLFMVGDVKQSIYKFRQARPELFIQKYETYQLEEDKKEEDSLKIQLFKNFRSRENVLKTTNQIFEEIMSKDLGDIEYNEEEYLNLGADYPELEENNLKTELHILDLKENKDDIIEDETQTEQVEDMVLEAKFVAKKIKELIQSNYQVYDKKIGYRQIQYKDIVILLRATSSLAPIYEKELNTQEIPVFSDVGNSYLDTIEIQTMLSLLKIIDNPMQDIPFVSVLRSPIGEFDDNDLIQIKLAGEKEKKNQYFYDSFLIGLESDAIKEELKQKMKTFLENLDQWRKEKEYMALDELIWKIYLDTGYYHYVSLMPNGLIRQANLRMLYEKAGEYEKVSFKGLFHFIVFMDQLKVSSGDMESAKLIGENENVVRIMSIHKSKGLEFPVVILASTSKKFNMRDLNEPILVHQEIGIGPKLIDSKRKIEYPTLAKVAIGNKVMQETISEEMRILYVALTRAKEKLIIVGREKDLQKELAKKEEMLEIYKGKKIGVNSLKQYKSYLDWIELVYLKNKEQMKDIMELHCYEKAQWISQNNEEETEIKKNYFAKESTDYELHKELEESLNWNYANKIDSQIPTKTSVSKLKQFDIEEKTIDFLSLTEQERRPKEKTIPQFLKEEVKVTNAKKGSLVHLCIEHLNETEEYTKEKIQNLIQMLVQKQFILQTEAEYIDVETILTYTKSDLFQELKQAKEVKKEQPFYINIEAKEIYKVETNEKILVQGVIDLYYIDQQDNIMLVDYKTDFVKDEKELIEKYHKQLEIYRRALEQALGNKVEAVYIYSTYLQRKVKIDC